MDTYTTEQALRREAIRRRLQGEARRVICQALGCSRRWFDKWRAEYRRDPTTDFGDRSRAPHTSPQPMPGEVRQAVWLTQHADKTSASTRLHLLKTWAKLGVPFIHQFDNEGAFCGGHAHPHVLGQVVRLCLRAACGVEPLFTPFYDPKRNHQIETFHSVWIAGCWSRQQFRDRAHLAAETPLFWRWYMRHYSPPALDGKTPAQMRRGVPLLALTPTLRRLIPAGRLPLTVGRLHFMRKVQTDGTLEVLNEIRPAGRQWIGQYVRVTSDTHQQTIAVWHKADEQAEWRLLKTRRFQLKEKVHALLPEFRRNRARCRDY